MPILNYTTKISASKTIGEIQEILVDHGATKIVCDYDEFRLPSQVTFSIPMNGEKVFFALPARYEGVLAAMTANKKVPRASCTKEQAVRVAWRIMKDWIEAQCAIIEAGLAEMPEVFLPYAVTQKGTTLYNELKGDSKLFLTQ